MLSRKLKIKKGLTLLELIIVLGLMSIVTMLVFSFMNLTQKKTSELDIKQQLQHEGTLITESLMSNILESTGIYSIDKKNFDANDNKINHISFKLNEIFATEVDGSMRSIDRLMYEITGDGLIVRGHEILSSDRCTENNIIQEHWDYLDVISPFVTELRLDNKEIVDGWASSLSEIDMNKVIEEAKGINLKLVLKDSYMENEILHGHTVELNLRNAK